jgi:hypothetical protein
VTADRKLTGCNTEIVVIVLVSAQVNTLRLRDVMRIAAFAA